MLDGTPFCCSGCGQGGPCICSYGNPSMGRQKPLAIPNRHSSPLPDSGGSPNHAASFTRMVENIIEEVEITRQIVTEEAGPVNDLLGLLDKASRLLQVMAHRLEGPQSVSAPGSSTRFPLRSSSQEGCENITLVVENATEPDIVFSYTRALSKLGSVRDMKLVSINKTSLLYQVETRSKAKFAREVMSLPAYRPVRIRATLDDITVRLNAPEDVASNLEKLLSDTNVGSVEKPAPTVEGPL